MLIQQAIHFRGMQPLLTQLINLDSVVLEDYSDLGENYFRNGENLRLRNLPSLRSNDL
jgi:hypothetical protein